MATTPKTTPAKPRKNTKNLADKKNKGGDTKKLPPVLANEVDGQSNTQLRKRIAHIVSGMTYKQAESLLFRVMEDLQSRAVIAS